MKKSISLPPGLRCKKTGGKDLRRKHRHMPKHIRFARRLKPRSRKPRVLTKLNLNLEVVEFTREWQVDGKQRAWESERAKRYFLDPRASLDAAKQGLKPMSQTVAEASSRLIEWKAYLQISVHHQYRMERRTLSDLYSEQVRRLVESESFTITWTKDGVVLPEYANQTKVVISPEETGFEAR
ncbi:hypothetical protein BT96DRAFT_1070717 [Gymnopus androsaceus JB14]|uniref:Uncharacterized protein n=1 Tax=Gymnopus androsaceus JB14 TaxID=1447944 RepID=A0A6A4GW42_9AGAR|nr:hypothetical protein BT96DRAFT_1070717 [Gymnopus androsaceus JB14]